MQSLANYGFITLLTVFLIAGHSFYSASGSDEDATFILPPQPQSESTTGQSSNPYSLTDVPHTDDNLRWKSTFSTNVTMEQQPYDLESFIAWACANNPTLRQANLQISATLAKAQQAGLYPNPIMAYVGENIGVDGTAGEFQGGELQQRLVTANKLELSRNKYLQRAKVAEHQAIAQQFRVCNQVRILFVKTQAAQLQLRLERELLKTAEDDLVTSKELFNLGQANQVDIHKTTANLRRQKLAVLRAENMVRHHFFELTSVVGVELEYQPLEGSMQSEHDLIDFDSSYERIRSQSPEILAAYSKLREDHITVHRERVEWVPDIVVSAGAGRNYEARDNVANARVQLEIPLFDRNQGTIRQAQLDQSRQRQEIRRLELQLRRKLAHQYDVYLTALQHVMAFDETVLPEMKQAYEQTLKSYQADREEWPAVLMAHREYTERRREYVTHLMEVRTSEILIDGYLLQGGLEAASNPTPTGHIDSTPKPR